MKTSLDMDFEAQETDEGVVRAGSLTVSDDGVEMRVMVALVQTEDGQLDVELVTGPSRPSAFDQRNRMVLRGAAGRGLLRLCTRAYRILQEDRKADE